MDQVLKFSPEIKFINTKFIQFEDLKLLGRGGYAKVYYSKSINDVIKNAPSKNLVIKKFNENEELNEMCITDIEYKCMDGSIFKAEKVFFCDEETPIIEYMFANIFKDSDYFIKIYGFSDDGFLVMEKCDITLTNVLENLSDDEKINYILIKVLKAICIMKQDNIKFNHNDLHTDNIMINVLKDDIEVKIIDFGMSSKYGDGSPYTTILNYQAMENNLVSDYFNKGSDVALFISSVYKKYKCDTLKKLMVWMFKLPAINYDEIKKWWGEFQYKKLIESEINDYFVNEEYKNDVKDNILINLIETCYLSRKLRIVPQDYLHEITIDIRTFNSNYSHITPENALNFL